MNILEREARDIIGFLESRGYTCTQGLDHVVVKDPVHRCASNGMIRIDHYKDVEVRDWSAALRFVSVRS